MPGSSSWMSYASQGVKGFDDECFSTAMVVNANAPACFVTRTSPVLYS